MTLTLEDLAHVQNKGTQILGEMAVSIAQLDGPFRIGI
jgi:hypothetical protein